MRMPCLTLSLSLPLFPPLLLQRLSDSCTRLKLRVDADVAALLCELRRENSRRELQPLARSTSLTRSQQRLLYASESRQVEKE